jgi:anaerobic selenocysteine-containing dehydrogenase
LTETAQLADLHLAIKPGQDAVLLAGMIRLLIQKSLYDHDFCQQYTHDFAALKAQVDPYDLAFVAKQSGIDAILIEQAVELFGGQKRGCVSSGTGPDMGPHPNLSEHLICAMNTICGRHNRIGDKVNTSLLTPNMPPMEAVIPWDFLPPTLNLQANNRRSRVADARQVYQEMPSSTLADEILTAGQGQIKALIVIGGNPVLSLPDKAKIKQALSALDLLVCIDVRHTDTTALADYILPASYGLERPEAHRTAR